MLMATSYDSKSLIRLRVLIIKTHDEMKSNNESDFIMVNYREACKQATIILLSILPLGNDKDRQILLYLYKCKSALRSFTLWTIYEHLRFKFRKKLNLFSYSRHYAGLFKLWQSC